MGRSVVEMVYCFRNQQSACRQRSKNSRGINTSTCRLLIQTTQTFSLPLRYPKMNTAAVDLNRAAVAYIAAESILPFVSHGMKRCPSKLSVACAITKSAVDIGRRAPGQINTSTCRLLIQTTHTCSLPLRFPKMVTTAAVDRMFKTLLRANRVLCCRAIIRPGTINNPTFAAAMSTPTRFRSCRRLPNSSSHRASPHVLKVVPICSTPVVSVSRASNRCLQCDKS